MPKQGISIEEKQIAGLYGTRRMSAKEESKEGTSFEAQNVVTSSSLDTSSHFTPLIVDINNTNQATNTSGKLIKR